MVNYIIKYFITIHDLINNSMFEEFWRLCTFIYCKNDGYLYKQLKLNIKYAIIYYKNLSKVFIIVIRDNNLVILYKYIYINIID